MISAPVFIPHSTIPAIASVEESVAMLQRLATLGMCLAEEICERAITSPYHPEIKHEPGRAFATVSRAVRLTLVLKAKVEADLVALRKDEMVVADSPPVPRPDRARDGATAAPAETPDDGLDGATPETRRRERENLCERERFDEVLSRPFDECVAAIRAGLGLAAEDHTPSLRSADVPSATFAVYRADETPALRVGAQGPPDPG